MDFLKVKSLQYPLPEFILRVRSAATHTFTSHYVRLLFQSILEFSYSQFIIPNYLVLSRANYENYHILIRMGFRENLKSQLQYSGMLVKELAVRSGIKKKTIDSYLGTRSYTPSVDAAVNIAKALGVSVEYLVAGTEDGKDRPLSILPQDIQEIVSVVEHLNIKDRQVVLTVARSLKNR